MVPYLIESMKLTNLKILLGPALYLGSWGGGWMSQLQGCVGKLAPLLVCHVAAWAKGRYPPLTLSPQHLLQVKELTTPLTSCSTQEGCPCTLHGHHSRADPVYLVSSALRT